MAGHSQFKNIMHRKGAKDAKRAKLFTKLAREITVAAKQGLPDPAYNARLRSAIADAKAESMPRENIERAIKKASGADQDFPSVVDFRFVVSATDQIDDIIAAFEEFDRRARRLDGATMRQYAIDHLDWRHKAAAFGVGP